MEQVDAGGDDRRADPVLVEHERFGKVVEVTAMVRRVHEAAAMRGGFHLFDVFADAFDLPQNRVERVLERAVDGVALRRSELFEVAFDPFPRGLAGFSRAVLQVPRHLLPREHGLGELVDHRQPRL
jgi:hypothetical protein